MFRFVWPRAGACLAAGRRPGVQRGLPAVRARVPAGRRGFSILELIISVVVLALLLSLLAPTLSKVRRRAQDAVSLANLRSHAQVFALYASDRDDSLPYFTDPAATYSVVRGGDLAIQTNYFGAHTTWNIALADAYYDGHPLHESFFAPGYEAEFPTGDRPVLTRYFYSCTFLASPEYWDPSTRTGPDRWRRVRDAEVVFPGQKALLLAWYPWIEDLAGGDPIDNSVPAQVAFVDGSAPVVPAGDLEPQVSNGEGNYPPGTSHLIGAPPTLHTVHGARGRDVK